MAGNKEVSIWVTVNDQLTSKFKTMEGTVAGFEGKLAGIRGTLAAFGSGALLGGAAGGLVLAAKNWGKAVEEVSEQTGAAGEEASKLLVVAKRTGLGADETAGFMTKFGKSVSLAKDKMQEAQAAGKQSDDIFSRMGMTFQDLNDASLYTVFQKVSGFMRGMADGADKDRVAMELFGRAGRNMYDMLNMSSSEMDKAIEKAQKMGLIISSETAGAWKQFDRQLNAVQGSASKLAIGIGNELLPSLQKLLDATNNVVDKWTIMDKTQRESAANLVEWAAKVGLLAGGAMAAAKSVELLRGALLLLARHPVVTVGVILSYFAGDIADAIKKEQDEINKKRGYKYKIVGNHTEKVPLDQAPPAQSTGGNSYADIKRADNEAIQRQSEEKLNQLRGLAGDIDAALAKLQNNTLKQALADIDKQAQAFRNAKYDELKITQYIEESKSKAVKDAIEKRFGTEFAAVKKAYLEGKDPGEAYSKAAKEREADEKASYDANAYIRARKGIRLPGEYYSEVFSDRATGRIWSERRKNTELYIPDDTPNVVKVDRENNRIWTEKNDKQSTRMFDDYKPPAERISITVSPNITVQAVTPESKKQIIDDVADALTQALGQARNKQIDASY